MPTLMPIVAIFGSMERDADKSGLQGYVVGKGFCHGGPAESGSRGDGKESEQGKGTFRDGGAATGWREGARVQHAIPRYSDEAIAATIAYCEYVYERYGRFPANGGPFRTVLAHQAHHLDPDFCERFYRPGTLSEAQSQHQAWWHDNGGV